MTMTPAIVHMLEMARTFDFEPMKKATASVKDVIVMEGPACRIPYFILSSGLRSNEVWSMALQTTKMSSTPIPSIRTGKT